MFATAFFAHTYFPGPYFPPIGVVASPLGNRFGRITVIVDGPMRRPDDDEELACEKALSPAGAMLLISARKMARIQREATDDEDILMLMM